MATTKQGPVLPNAPPSLPQDAQQTWNETMRTLALFHNQVHWGLSGQNYTVSGTVPTSTTLDLGTVNVTAVAQTLAKLLIDLKKSGVLDVIETP